MSRRYVAICTEDHPNYPDPLIYTVDLVGNHDLPDRIEAAVIEQRIDELGEEFREEIEEKFHVKLVWEGDLSYYDYILDRRV